jgi:probable addiction module antidote protein
MSETNSSHPNSFRDNPMGIAQYLSPAFAKNELRTILDAINVVMRAQNVLALAQAMGIRREPLYRSFGGNIDPFFGRVLALLRALDVQLTVTAWPNPEPKSAAFKGFRDNPVAIARHLNKAFDSNELRTILEAINSVMRAQNVMALAKVSGLGREKLYKSFGGRIDPHFSRVIALLAAFGVQFQLKALKPTKKSPRPKLGRPPKGVQKGNNVVGRRRPRT